MKSFLQGLAGSILGVVITFMMGFLLLFLLMLGMVTQIQTTVKKSSKKPIKNNTVLHLKLDYPIEEYVSNNPWDQINMMSFKPVKRMSLKVLLNAIREARTDDQIPGIFLEAELSGADPSDIEELRIALKEFKESGKWIVSYQEIYTHMRYYLSSVADEIYLNPVGALEFTGLGAEIMFFKKALDKLEIDVQAIRASKNKYKSAIEPFLYEKMSEANRQQTEELLSGIWNHLLEGIASERNLDVKGLNHLASKLLIQNPSDAVRHQLVDEVKYRDEVLKILRSKCDLKEDGELSYISLSKYARRFMPDQFDIPENDSNKNVALVYADGTIVDGESDEQMISSGKLTQTLRDIRRSPEIKAVVLRVNSPGGSALASEVICREITLLKKEKIVVASFGYLAASGGYYIACTADKIFCRPTTITGSIGVFGVMPVIDKFFDKKLGLTFDHANTNDHSSFLSITKPLDKLELEVVQKRVDSIYETFKSRVAEGRSMTKSNVHEVAQGRVWTGRDALDAGLVDNIGGLQDAIDEAAKLAGLEKYEVKEYPEKKNPFNEFVEAWQTKVEFNQLKKSLGPLNAYFKVFKELQKARGVQARLPYFIKIY